MVRVKLLGVCQGRKVKNTCDKFPKAFTKATAAARFTRGRSIVFWVQAMSTALEPWPPATMRNIAKYRAPVTVLEAATMKPTVAAARGQMTWKEEFCNWSAEKLFPTVTNTEKI